MSRTTTYQELCRQVFNLMYILEFPFGIWYQSQSYPRIKITQSAPKLKLLLMSLLDVKGNIDFGTRLRNLLALAQSNSFIEISKCISFRRLISWFIYEYFLGSYYWLALGQTTLGFLQNGQSVAHAKNEPFSLLTNAPTTFDINTIAKSWQSTIANLS